MSEHWLSIPFCELPIASGNGINPYEFPEEEFELYSVPAHETGSPEIVSGKTIGSNKQIVSEGMALLCKINPRINRTWIVKPAAGRRQIASTEWIAFGHCAVLMPEYLKYYMQQSDFHDFLARNASGVGGSLMRIKPATFANYEFRMPGLRTQRAIVEKLEELFSDLDAGVSELNAAQKKLGQYRQSLLKAAVEGALTAEWRTKNKPRETGEQLLDRILVERRARWEAKQLAKFKDQGKTPPNGWKDKYPEPVKPDTSTFPELPEGWVWASADSLVSEIETGKSFKCEERPPNDEQVGVVKVSAVSWGEYDEQESKTCTDPTRVNEELFVRPGDFLFSRANTIELVGACVIASNITLRVMLSDKILRFVFVVDELKWWLLFLLRSDLGRTQIEKLASGNQESMRNIGQERIRQISIPLPPCQEIQQILAVLDTNLEAASAQRKAIETSLTQTSAQRKNILKSAFSGQLVPQDPSDEPASVLLERIRAERAARPDDKRRIRKKVSA